jgi:tetratricopeptide (TPR) repeat protein
MTREVEDVAQAFWQLSKRSVLFHSLFLILGVGQLLALLFFFPLFMKSYAMAILIASLFVTAFAYFVLRFYYEAKRPEEFTELCTAFVATCRRMVPRDAPVGEFPKAASRLIFRLMERIEERRNRRDFLPEAFSSLSFLLEHVFLWFHWKDLHDMKQLLLSAAARIHIQWVQESPLDLDAHVALASVYMAWYRLYLEPSNEGQTISMPFLSKAYASPGMREKLIKTARRALEELKILRDYSPKDPWVYAQFAAVYHDLGEFGQEIEAYETLSRLLPHERGLLFQLGALYFQHGRASYGLKVYEELKRSGDRKAEELISLYQ